MDDNPKEGTSPKLWGGRFTENMDRVVEGFTSSIDVDRRLYAYDIAGSIAHSKMLAKTGIITDDDADLLIQGLAKIKRDIEHQQFEFDKSLEDIHMNIEAQLVQEVGKTAQKLHTARSRNDQVALDVRMYLKDETDAIINRLGELRQAIVTFAEKNIDVILPGYTHLQRAQPVLFAHHFLAYYEMLTRDSERFENAYKRIDVMPLGSAALAGTSYPIDRNETAGLLKFARIARNSIDAVSDRDFIIEFLAAASICMVHLSRISEELILWSSIEFGFIEFPDAFATGSSIMPQKKNPDVAELIRGKAGRVFGNLMAMLTLMKSLPLAYNRDMQEDKASLFEGVDILKACLGIYTRLIPKLALNRQAMRIAASSGFLNATDLADYLVAKGMTFRDAHTCVGKAVQYALSKGRELQQLSTEELKQFCPLVETDAAKVLETEAVVNRRTSYGGTARKNVQAEVQQAKEQLKKSLNSKTA